MTFSVIKKLIRSNIKKVELYTCRVSTVWVTAEEKASLKTNGGFRPEL